MLLDVHHGDLLSPWTVTHNHTQSCMYVLDCHVSRVVATSTCRTAGFGFLAGYVHVSLGNPAGESSRRLCCEPRDDEPKSGDDEIKAADELKSGDARHVCLTQCAAPSVGPLERLASERGSVLSKVHKTAEASRAMYEFGWNHTEFAPSCCNNTLENKARRARLDERGIRLRSRSAVCGRPFALRI